MVVLATEGITMGVTHENPQGMTLAELRTFLEFCQLAGISEETSVPTVRVSLRSTIKRIEVKSASER